MPPLRTITFLTALAATTACATPESGATAASGLTPETARAPQTSATATAPTTATSPVPASGAESTVADVPDDAPDIVARLPADIGSFTYEGFKHFSDGSGGFSVRYGNKRKRRLADVYVYPVATENREMAHEKLVLGSTQATMRAIGEAVRQGLYANFNVLTAATKARGVRTVARVQATYLRQNLASYTLVYQTEHEGTLLKIRLSMPDNESNRGSEEWDRFAERLFELIERDLDGTAA